MSIALCVMVKNGRKKLPKLFASLPPFITKIMVLDTGSMDGTAHWIMEWVKDNPKTELQIRHRPFDNFAGSRNYLMKEAKGFADWLLLMDDDWTLEVTAPVEDILSALASTKHNVLSLKIIMSDGVEFWSRKLVRGNHEWKYEGVVHEQLRGDTENAKMSGLVIHAHFEATKEKFERYHYLLFEELAKNPDNAYIVFRIALNLIGMKKYDAAVRFFGMRVTMGGFAEEVYVSLFQMAHLMQDPAIMEQAAAFRPTRAEAPAWLRDYWKAKKNHSMAAYWEAIRSQISYPSDNVYVDPKCYDHTPT